MPRRKTHSEFVSQVKHLPITIKGRYTGNRQKLDIECNKCGHEWGMRVDHILAEKGCPVCARLRITKTTEEYRSELSSCGITLLSEYKTRNVKVRLACNTCGHKWTSTPDWCAKNCPMCAAKENGGKSKKPPSDYYIKDGVAFISVKDHVIEMDSEDLKLIDRAIGVDDKGYPFIKINRRNVFIHKLIMTDSSKMVDHKDRRPLNNRRSNLRYVTRSQNAMNSKVRSDSTSGIKGVSYRKKWRKWIATICKDGDVRYLGSFDDVEIAIGVRREAELELFGEYSPLSN